VYDRPYPLNPGKEALTERFYSYSKLGGTMFRNITLLILAIATMASAQSTFGSFVGTLRDPSGAVIGGAMVQVTNKGTSAQRGVITDETGSFNVVNLDPGTYD